MRFLLFMAAALVATLPSVGIARVYLARRQIALVGEETTVQKFMQVAPVPFRAALITLNFVIFGAFLWLGWRFT
ncbi:MAG: hypothetical protein H6721_20870 [Sandaracinus sp.]|nr:hypothetical protein [Myxococcales bacterium]MCB9617867.1 hypothetical protein [Sandaracinus sp.]MCB9634585.1 hypothetical protein [Sandaracinus sp.]